MTETVEAHTLPASAPADFQTAEYLIFPLTEAIVIGLAAFLAIFSTTFFVYHHAIEAQKGEIREGLIRTGNVLVSFIDADMHRTFVSPEQEDSQEYKDAILPFQKILKADPSIAFVYTAIMKDGKVHFILDPTEAGDSDGDGVDDKAHIMDEYTEASADMIEALSQQKSVTSKEPYVDRWGSFVSGYIPFYDREGKFVGVLGVDIDSTNYFSRLAPMKRATIRAMVTGFFVAFIVGAAVWFMRNFSRIINHSRLTIHREYKKVIGQIHTKPQTPSSGS